MTPGRYRNKIDDSVLEVYRVNDKREIKLKARWIQSKTKSGQEFDLTDNFNKFETFEKITI